MSRYAVIPLKLLSSQVWQKPTTNCRGIVKRWLHTNYSDIFAVNPGTYWLVNQSTNSMYTATTPSQYYEFIVVYYFKGT